MKTKVKFPVFFKQDGPQFLTFMKFLEKNGVKWVGGESPTCLRDSNKGFSSLKFPIYILYWDYGKLGWPKFKRISYLNAKDAAEWFDSHYFRNEEIEFENE